MSHRDLTEQAILDNIVFRFVIRIHITKLSCVDLKGFQLQFRIFAYNYHRSIGHRVDNLLK